MSDCSSGLLSNFLPDIGGDFKVFAAYSKSLKLACPEIDKIGNNIFEEEVEPLPCRSSCIIQRSNTTQTWQSFNTGLFCNLRLHCFRISHRNY